MDLFYARTSSKEQSIARQLEAAYKLGITEEGENLFIDKMTGTTFKRPAYEQMKAKLRAGDKIYVHELDRFGRNYEEIKNQIVEIESKGVEIIFMDLPLVNHKTDDPLVTKMLRDQCITLLSFLAQKETEKRKKRQREGLDAMKRNEEGKRISEKTGNAMGRPKAALPKDFEKIYNRVQKGELTTVEAQKLLDIKKTSYFKYAKILKESKMKDQMPGQTYLLAD